MPFNCVETDLLAETLLGEIALGTTHFMLVISAAFSALVRSNMTQVSVEPAPSQPHSVYFQVGLTFDPEAILAFVSQMSLLLKPSTALWNRLQKVRSVVQLNNAKIQGEFTLKLVSVFASSATDAEPEPAVAQMEAERQVATQMSLLQQVAQERLLQQVTT